MNAPLSPSNTFGSTGVPRALVALLRGALGRQWGVRIARIYAALVTLGVAATIWVVARTRGSDDVVLSLLARAAGTLAWISGGLAALSLSVPPKDQALTHGIEALATARGVSDNGFARAEILATLRLLVEIIVLPIAAIGLFILAIVSRGQLGGAARPVLGALIFGLLTSVVLALISSACRRLGRGRGRTWFAMIVLAPWVLSKLASDRGGALLSIPGALGHLWSALTAMGS